MSFRCPGCNVKLKTKPRQAGKRLPCPRCGTTVTVPTIDETGAGVSAASAAPETEKLSSVDTPRAIPGDATAEDAVPEVWKPGGVILDLYEVKDIAGEGGFATVYRVRHLGWNMDLAVKSPLADKFRSEQQRSSIEQECETWIDLGLHPHIVSCYYVRRLGGIPRVFAEFVEGGSLRDWIVKGKTKDLRTALDIAIQIAWGMAHAHQKGLVHRDLKPRNVLMTPGGTAKVTDFGLAGRGAVMGFGGTPGYGAPEQWKEGKTVDQRADIFAFGVTLWRMVGGPVSWADEKEPGKSIGAKHAVARLLKRGELAPPPGELLALIRRCLEPEPDDRWPDFPSLCGQLQALYAEVAHERYTQPEPRPADLLADGLNNQAVSLLDLQKDEAAKRLWREALAADATHAPSRVNLAIHAWQRRDDSFADCLRSALALASDVSRESVDVSVLTPLAYLLVGEERVREAKTIAERAVRLAPQAEAAWILLLALYLCFGETRHAERATEKTCGVLRLAESEKLHLQALLRSCDKPYDVQLLRQRVSEPQPFASPTGYVIWHEHSDEDCLRLLLPPPWPVIARPVETEELLKQEDWLNDVLVQARELSKSGKFGEAYRVLRSAAKKAKPDRRLMDALAEVGKHGRRVGVEDFWVGSTHSVTAQATALASIDCQRSLLGLEGGQLVWWLVSRSTIEPAGQLRDQRITALAAVDERIAVGTAGGRVLIVTPDTGTESHHWTVAHGPVDVLDVSRQRDQVLCGSSRTGELFVCSVDGQRKTRVIPPLAEKPKSAGWVAPDVIAVVGHGGLVFLLNPRNSRVVRGWVHKQIRFSSFVSVSDSLYALGTQRGEIQLWGPSDGDFVGRLWGHTTDVVWLAPTPDGRFLLSSDAGGEVRVWQVSEQRALATARAGKRLSTLEIVPGERFLIALTSEGAPLSFEIDWEGEFPAELDK